MKSGGHRRDSILGDTVEALIGAIYLDGGIEAAREIVVAWFKSFLDSALQTQPVKDAKTALQEWLQHRNKPLPDYQLIGTGGEAHSRLFTVSCQISAVETTMTATATSRRRAEQMVAEQLLEEVEKSK
jgi:ribonuclease-3